MPVADALIQEIDGLLDAPRAEGIASALSVWTPQGSVTRWITPEAAAQQEPAFLIYSITKTFIACLLLQLADAGRLDLDAPVRSLWRGPALPASFTDAVTPRRLLNHTAGLPDYGALPDYQAQVRQHPHQPWSTEHFTQATLARDWAVPEPARFAYSNPGYMVLRQLLEMVGESPWEQQLAERVCGPLGLSRTTVASTLDDLRLLAPGLSRQIAEGNAWVDVRGRYHPGWVSHGVIASTVSEVSAFLHALFSGRLLQPTSLAAMFDAMPAGQVGGRWQQPGYGLGLMIDPGMPIGLVRGHNGGGPGYSASAFGLWQEGELQAICTTLVGGGQGDAEVLTFQALASVAGA
jgi:D-alanyl-D-alanine carboxypeptidase